MAYLEVTNLHALPVDNYSRKSLPPAAILFPRGPEWEWRFQRNQRFDHLDNRFMYKDQGPPMYRLLGHHYNMYRTPPRTDHHAYSRSYHYEPRQYNSPSYRNGAIAFPTGPPPAQVAMFDGLKEPRQLAPKTAHLEMPGRTVKSFKAYDQYRYLPGPPSETVIYGRPQGWEKLPAV
ncbi:uncharacterized protein LOC101863927 isoform X3 [Aplysia californica]|nr:uncharacterized protein LOC101863927 isoform X3 [Aplysia californica]XP_012942293.1 uncharacterized protein LOC101863927 isoform X3 [Aplysia californica]